MLEKRQIPSPYVPDSYDADYYAYDNIQAEDEINED